MATPRIAESVGRVLGDRYRLTRPLGVGASAHVYVAEDVSLRRRVAIKLLHPALAGDEGFLRRFRAEAQVVAALRHPNILRIYDWGEDTGTPYLVMELLEGGNLRALLDAGNLLSLAQAAAVGASAARALDYAHRRGLVHRDIKPANLIFDDEGRLTVADFGLARALAEATWTEPTGAVVGTARYAAPEQARGEKLDSRADVYSLALVLVEATTGLVPFAADTTLGTLMARLERPLTVPEGVDLGGLGPILEAAGTVAPKDRMDAADLALALDGVASWFPPPPPLPLVSPLVSGEAERDASPTEYPGKPRLFDGTQYDDDPPDPVPGRRADGETVYVPRGGVGDADLVRPAPDVASPAARVVFDEPAELPPPDGESVRHRLRTALVLLVVLALLAAGAVAAVILTKADTPSHPVPVLIGDTETTAAQALRPFHLHVTVTARSYDPHHAAGTVLAQQPPAGSSLKEGQGVDVTLSLGPQPVPAPHLAGDTQQVAVSVLGTLGLKAQPITTASSMTVPAGTVISSHPDTGMIVPGQSVALVVSTGKPKAPVPPLGVNGLASFAGAQAALKAAGFKAAEKDTYNDTVPKGQVIGTDPPAGTTAIEGSTITVIISKGPHTVAVPYVAGGSVGAASQTLSGQGFQISGVTGNPIATVTGTSPPAGSMVLYGSPVQILTG